MPNGMSGMVWVTKRRMLELLAALPGDVVVAEGPPVVAADGVSYRPPVTAEELAQGVAAFHRQDLFVSIQERRYFVLHMGEHFSEWTKWFSVKENSPLFSVLRTAPTAMRRYEVLLVAALGDKAVSDAIYAELVQPLGELHLSVNQLSIAPVGGSFARDLSAAASMVLVVGPSWTVDASLQVQSSHMVAAAVAAQLTVVPVIAGRADEPLRSRLPPIPRVVMISMNNRRWDRQLVDALKAAESREKERWRKEREDW